MDMLKGLKQYDGLDTPYDPAMDEDPEEDESISIERWRDWQEYAKKKGRTMRTYRDVIEFMAELGLLERRTDGGSVFWEVSESIPLAEDVLPLSPERRELEARIRWRDTFHSDANAITTWLVDQRIEGALVLEIETSISDLAAELDLDLENARHGLACAVTEASDMWATPDPETALLTTQIRITVDWQRFDAERFSIRLALPED